MNAKKGMIISFLLCSVCLLFVVGIGVQWLAAGTLTWQRMIAAVILDNNGQNVCRSLEREGNFQLAAAQVEQGSHGVQLRASGIQDGRLYCFFRQPSPENSRQTLYRSVSVNGREAGVNPLTDSRSVEVVDWQLVQLANNVILVTFKLRETRWGKERGYHVFLTLYNTATDTVRTKAAVR